MRWLYIDGLFFDFDWVRAILYFTGSENFVINSNLLKSFKLIAEFGLRLLGDFCFLGL